MKMFSYIEGTVYGAVALQYVIKQELEYKNKLGVGKKAKCLSRGFSSEKYELYDLEKKDMKLYLSDFQRRKAAKINGRYSMTVSDKKVFAQLLASTDMTAKLYGTVKKGVVVLGDKEVTLEAFLSFVKEKQKVILKVYNGGGGKGIYKLSYSGDTLAMNDEVVTDEVLKAELKNLDYFLIMEHLEQAAYASEIYPGTINSIRILTMVDPETKEVFIPIAVHKFGSEKTKPADNVWRGGMTALIDSETGILKQSALHYAKNKKIKWESTHPDTGATIEGVQIPNWEQVKKEVIALAQSMDYLQYVGWDVVVTEDGVKIIEGNNCSDVNILQIHKPLLSDERVKAFYKHHRIVR